MMSRRMGILRRHFPEPDLFRQEFFGVFNTPWRVHLYIRNTEAAIKLRYPWSLFSHRPAAPSR